MAIPAAPSPFPGAWPGGKRKGDLSPPSELKFTHPLLLGPVFQEFVKMTNYDVEHTIKKEMSGDVRDVFVAIGN